MEDNFPNLQNLLQDLSELITKMREDYNCHLANKLKNPQSSPKTFWIILKTFLQWEHNTINTSNYSQ